MFRTLGIKLLNFLFPVQPELAFVGETNMTAVVVPLENGRFGLVARGGGILNTYARARDARRGAKRLGYVVA